MEKIEEFAVARRRHDELYWARVWLAARGSVTVAARLAATSRKVTREYLEGLGFRCLRGRVSPTAEVLHARMATPTVAEALGRTMDLAEVEGLTPEQRTAAWHWTSALGVKGATGYSQVVPGFLLGPRSE